MQWDTGGVLAPLWEPSSPRLKLSGMSSYVYDSLYHRMRPFP